MIRVSHLTKRYGKTTAIDDLSFEVGRGEIVGLLGPNGAGKTTTLRILSCYIAATSGTVTIGGLDVRKHSLDVRRSIGYLPENVALYPDMRVKEYLYYRAGLKGLAGRRRRERVKETMARCGVEGVRRQIIGRLSRGYLQRVGLADCLLHDPQVLILDEPTLGLDPNQIRNVRGLIQELAEDHTVLFSTHILNEVEMICRRVLIMNKGKVVASDTPERLAGLMKGRISVTAEIRGPYDAVLARLKALPSLANVTGVAGAEWGVFTLEADEGVDIRAAVFESVAQGGWVLRELRCEKKSLEDVFVAVTGGAGLP